MYLIFILLKIIQGIHRRIKAKIWRDIFFNRKAKQKAIERSEAAASIVKYIYFLKTSTILLLSQNVLKFLLSLILFTRLPNL